MATTEDVKKWEEQYGSATAGGVNIVDNNGKIIDNVPYSNKIGDALSGNGKVYRAQDGSWQSKEPSYMTLDEKTGKITIVAPKSTIENADWLKSQFTNNEEFKALSASLKADPQGKTSVTYTDADGNVKQTTLKDMFEKYQKAFNDYAKDYEKLEKVRDQVKKETASGIKMSDNDVLIYNSTVNKGENKYDSNTPVYLPDFALPYFDLKKIGSYNAKDQTISAKDFYEWYNLDDGTEGKDELILKLTDEAANEVVFWQKWRGKSEADTDFDESAAGHQYARAASFYKTLLNDNPDAGIFTSARFLGVSALNSLTDNLMTTTGNVLQFTSDFVNYLDQVDDMIVPLKILNAPIKGIATAGQLSADLFYSAGKDIAGIESPAITREREELSEIGFIGMIGNALIDGDYEPLLDIVETAAGIANDDVSVKNLKTTVHDMLIESHNDMTRLSSAATAGSFLGGALAEILKMVFTNAVGGAVISGMNASVSALESGAKTMKSLSEIVPLYGNAEDIEMGMRIIAGGLSAKQMAGVVKAGAFATNMIAQGISDTILDDADALHKMFTEGDVTDAIEAVRIHTIYNTVGEMIGLGATKGGAWLKGTKGGQAVEAFTQRKINKLSAVKHEALARLAKTMEDLTGNKIGGEKWNKAFHREVAEASRNIANAGDLAKEGETIVEATRRMVLNKIDLEVAYGRISRRSARTILELQTDPRVSKYFSAADDAAGKVIKLEKAAGLEKGALKQFTQETSNYIYKQNRIEYLIAKGGDKLKNLTKAEKTYLKALQEKVAAFEDSASQELLDAISDYVSKAKIYQYKFNNLLEEEGLLDKVTQKERRSTGYWGKRGENYLFSQTLKPEESSLKAADAAVTKLSSGENFKLKHDMDEYHYKPGDENANYMDPQLALFTQQVSAAKVMDGRRWGNALLKTQATAKQIDVDGKPVSVPELKKIRREVYRTASDTLRKFRTTGDFKQYSFGIFYKQRENLTKRLAKEQGRVEKLLKVSDSQKNSIALDLDQDGIALLSKRFDIPEYGTIRTRAELEYLYNNASAGQKAAIEQAVGIDNNYLSSLRKKRAKYESKLGAAKQSKVDVEGRTPSEININRYTARTKRARAAANEPTPSNASQYYSPESPRTAPGRTIEELEGDFRTWARTGNEPEVPTTSSSDIVNLSPADTTGRVSKDLEKRIGKYQTKIRELNKEEAEILNRLNVRTYNDAIRNTDLSQRMTNVYISESENIMKSKTFEKYAREVRKNTLTARQRTVLKKSYEEITAMQKEMGLVEAGTDEFTKTIAEFTEDLVETISEQLKKNKFFTDTLQKYIDAGVNEKEAVRYLALDQLQNAIGGKAYNELIERSLRTQAVSGNLTNNQQDRFFLAIKKAIEENIDSECRSAVQIMTKNGAGDLVDTEKVFKETYELMDDFIKNQVKTPNVIQVMTEDGDFKLYEVSPVTAELYNERPNFSNIRHGFAAKFFNQTNRIFKLATSGYGLSSFTNQWMRDPLSSWVMAGMVKTFKGNTEELGRLLGDDVVGAIQKELGEEGWENLLERAGSEATAKEAIADEVARQADILYGDTAPEVQLYREMATGRRETLFGDYEKPVGKMEQKLRQLEDHSLGNRRELYLRKTNYMQAYNEAIALGRTTKEAKNWAELVADNATTDFSRTFAWGSQIIHNVPYLGAAINGSASFWRLLELDPIGISGRFIGGLALPQMSLTAQSLQGEENRRAYMGVPEYIKQENLVWAADGQVFKIPIPQELSAFLQPFRYVVEKAMNGTDETWGELVLNNILSISPINLTGLADLDDPLDKDADFFGRLSNEAETLIAQLSPVALKTAYMAYTGRDPYTHSPIDTSRTWRDDEGNPQIMDSTDSNFAQWVSSTLKGFGINLSASSAEALLTQFFGQASIDLADTIMKVFSGDIIGAVNVPAKQLTKPFTVYSYDQANYAWKKAVKELEAEKNELIRADGELAKINNDIGTTSDPEKLKNFRQQYREIVQGYQDKVLNMVQKFNSIYGADYDWKKYTSTLQLLSFYSTAQDLTTEGAKQDAQNLYFAAQESAKRTMANMGFNGTNDFSIFGYLHTDQYGNNEVRATLPSSILDMDNVFYQARDAAAAKITNIIEKTQDSSGKTLKDKYKEMQKKETELINNKKYNEKNKLYKEWDIELMTQIYPVLAENNLQDQYGNDLLDNKDFIESFWKYIRVPDDYMGKGKYISSKTGLNKQDGYKRSYIKHLYDKIGEIE